MATLTQTATAMATLNANSASHGPSYNKSDGSQGHRPEKCSNKSYSHNNIHIHPDCYMSRSKHPLLQPQVRQSSQSRYFSISPPTATIPAGNHAPKAYCSLISHLSLVPCSLPGRMGWCRRRSWRGRANSFGGRPWQMQRENHLPSSRRDPSPPLPALDVEMCSAHICCVTYVPACLVPCAVTRIELPSWTHARSRTTSKHISRFAVRSHGNWPQQEPHKKLDALEHECHLVTPPPNPRLFSPSQSDASDSPAPAPAPAQAGDAATTAG